MNVLNVTFTKNLFKKTFRQIEYIRIFIFEKIAKIVD